MGKRYINFTRSINCRLVDEECIQLKIEGKPLARYIILDIRVPTHADYEADIEWICRCFGFLEARDKEKTASKIFRIMLEAMREGRGLTSDEVAEAVGMTRGTVVHHLNRMIGSGLIVRRAGQYELRGLSLQRTVQEIRKDVNRVLDNAEQVAKSIDEALRISQHKHSSMAT
ncbi:MAG: ArsR family transcriptional regulator [Nitrososphaerota archaeon]|nr:ArsR family transcriptional regulator [Nitrososphaerota archaeon]